jgi:hypothetical protein
MDKTFYIDDIGCFSHLQEGQKVLPEPGRRYECWRPGTSVREPGEVKWVTRRDHELYAEMTTGNQFRVTGEHDCHSLIPFDAA